MNTRKILTPIIVIVVCAALGGALWYAGHPQKAAQPAAAPVATSSASAARATTPVVSHTVAATPTPHATAPAKPAAATTTPQVQPSAAIGNASIVIGSTRYAIEVPQGGATVADLMQQLASINKSFTYTTKTYPGLGLFVESINGKENSGNEYWFLYVNGKETQTGMSSTTAHPGDVIEWNYQM